MTQTGDHLTTPTWPQGWNDYGGYETRYTHKSSAYWAKVRDWNQARNPGLSLVNLDNSPWLYSDALQHVGKPVYVRRYYWSEKISEITGLKREGKSKKCLSLGTTSWKNDWSERISGVTNDIRSWELRNLRLVAIRAVPVQAWILTWLVLAFVAWGLVCPLVASY